MVIILLEINSYNKKICVHETVNRKLVHCIEIFWKEFLLCTYSSMQCRGRLGYFARSRQHTRTLCRFSDITDPTLDQLSDYVTKIVWNIIKAFQFSTLS